MLRQRLPTGRKATESCSTTPKLNLLTSQLIPGLPKVGDRFISYEVGYLTLRTLIIPVTGVGLSPQHKKLNSRDVLCNRGGNHYIEACRCQLEVAFDFDDAEGAGCTVSADSCFYHNHGRDIKIIENPDWKPRVKSGAAYDQAEELRTVSE